MAIINVSAFNLLQLAQSDKSNPKGEATSSFIIFQETLIVSPKLNTSKNTLFLNHSVRVDRSKVNLIVSQHIGYIQRASRIAAQVSIFDWFGLAQSAGPTKYQKPANVFVISQSTVVRNSKFAGGPFNLVQRVKVIHNAPQHPANVFVVSSFATGYLANRNPRCNG